MGPRRPVRPDQRLAVPAAATAGDHLDRVRPGSQPGRGARAVRPARSGRRTRRRSPTSGRISRGTFDPPGHWNQIAAIAAIASKSGLEDSARTFALVDIALADAGIEAWTVKYTYNTARPVTVVRDGADGVNPGIRADPTWTPLWNTPAFPSYISGHSTFSAAAATVLTSVYGDHFAFTDPGDPTLDLAPRHFASFEAAAEEAGMSRIYGGIHFMSDNVSGLQVGGEVGQYVARHELLSLKSGKG